MVPFGRDREMDEALSACLDRMAGGDSVEECLADHRALADRLRPLLEAALAARSAAVAMGPSPASRARGRARLRERLPAGPPAAGRRRWLRAPRYVAIPAAAALAVAAVVFGGGGIAVAAAADAVPGDTLYWVKRAKESVMLSLSRSDGERARMHAELAGVRGEEMGRLIEQGRISAAERHLGSVHSHLRATTEHVGVVVTLNRIEAPSPSVAAEGNADLLALVVTLERDGDLLRIRPIAVGAALPQDQASRIERLRRDFELSYRVVVAALYPDAATGPFWRFQTISIQSSVR